MIEVKVGQIWQDLGTGGGYVRSRRQFRVCAVGKLIARVRNIATNRLSYIKLRRFHRYVMVQDAPSIMPPLNYVVKHGPTKEFVGMDE